jgi:hypothetical protein
MTGTEAARYLNRLVLRPGWRLVAKASYDPDYVRVVLLNYGVRDSDSPPNYDQFVEGERVWTPMNSYNIYVRDCNESKLQAKLLNAILNLELHEWREFLREPSSAPGSRHGWKALFHSHRNDGNMRMAQYADDIGLKEAA